MNVENILKVADAIEQHSIAELGFNMGLFQGFGGQFYDHTGHNCGTTACIGGWANAIQSKTLVEAGDLTEADARNFLGLSPAKASDLFYARNYPENLISPDEDYFIGITAEQAVATLRHLAATGKVDWAIGSTPPREGSDYQMEAVS